MLDLEAPIGAAVHDREQAVFDLGDRARDVGVEEPRACDHEHEAEHEDPERRPDQGPQDRGTLEARDAHQHEAVPVAVAFERVGGGDEVARQAADVLHLGGGERLEGCVLCGCGGEGLDDLVGGAGRLGDHVDAVAVLDGRGERSPAGALARVGEALVVEGGACHDPAEEHPGLVADRRVGGEQLLVAGAVHPDVGAGGPAGERLFEGGVDRAEVVAAHQGGAVAADDDPVLVDQRDEGDRDRRQLGRRSAGVAELVGDVGGALGAGAGVERLPELGIACPRGEPAFEHEAVELELRRGGRERSRRFARRGEVAQCGAGERV